MAEIKYPLMGIDIILDEKAVAFNTLRKKFVILAKDCSKKVSAYYDSHIAGGRDFISYCASGLEDIFKDYLQQGVIELVSYGIYDIDEVVLEDIIEKEDGLCYKKAIAEIIDIFADMDRKQEAADRERMAMIEAAGNSVKSMEYIGTGDFCTDVNGMVTGVMEDVAVNAILAGGTAVVTGGLRAIDKKRAQKEKEDLIDNQSTKIRIIDGFEKDVFMIHKTVAKIINEQVEDIFYYASDDSINVLEPITRNIIRGNFSHDNKVENLEGKQIKIVLENNPYEARVFSYIVKKNGGLTDEVKTLVEFLSIDMEMMADAYMFECFDMSVYTAYEDILPFEQRVIEEMKTFGIEECDYYHQVCIRKQALFDERRTFNSYIYETIEDRDKAEDQYVSYLEDKLESMDREELMNKFCSTFDESYYEKNREDLQMITMEYMKEDIVIINDTYDIDMFISKTQQKHMEYGQDDSVLLKELLKKRKQLYMKKQIAEFSNNVKDNLMSTASTAKTKGKELLSQMQLPKKAASDKPMLEDKSEPEEVIIESEPVAKKSILGGAKNMFSGATDKLKNSAGNIMSGKGSAGSDDDKQNDNQADGTEIESVDDGSSVEGQTAEEVATTKTCPQCSGTVKIASKFCGKCGYKF